MRKKSLSIKYLIYEKVFRVLISTFRIEFLHFYSGIRKKLAKRKQYGGILDREENKSWFDIAPLLFTPQSRSNKEM